MFWVKSRRKVFYNGIERQEEAVTKQRRDSMEWQLLYAKKQRKISKNTQRLKRKIKKIEIFYKNFLICPTFCPTLNILVQQSHQSSVARATIPAVQSQQKFYAAKGSLHEQAYDRLLCLGKHACKEWGLLCREYICCGGSCQEHRGIIFLLAILDGSLFQEGWLQNTGQVAPKSQEYSHMGVYNIDNVFL